MTNVQLWLFLYFSDELMKKQPPPSRAYSITPALSQFMLKLKALAHPAIEMVIQIKHVDSGHRFSRQIEPVRTLNFDFIILSSTVNPFKILQTHSYSCHV